jgi:hypothetical protein
MMQFLPTYVCVVDIFLIFFWSLSIACYCLNDLLRRGGREEWLRDQCILREAAGGGRSLGLI